MTANSTITRQLRISGRVQGVSYRAHARATALKLGLSGWARNRANGDVEAWVCGPADAVEAFIAWAHQGPPAARVSRVEVSDAMPQAPLEPGFHILPDA